MSRSSDLILWSVRQGMELFEDEFGLKVQSERVT
jgi:hypothetical protein